MHEYSLVEAMFQQIADAMRAHGATAVHRVRVSIGARAGVEPELFRTAYDVYRIGTACAAAPLEVVTGDGDDLVLDQIEMEVP